MSYLGNSPELNTFTVGVEKFNGSGACTAFTLTRDIDDPNYLEVVVGGVQQTPYDAYTVTNGSITFATPPILGVNNVVVIYRTGTTIAYNQIAASQLLTGSVTETALATNSVTNSKIAQNAVTGDKLGIQSVSGNNIGLGAISANNFAGGGITSNVLSQNLSISITRVLETANVFTTAPTGNLQIDISNNTLYYFSSNTTGNVTFNLRGNNVNTFDSTVNVGQTVSLAIGLRHGIVAGPTGGRHTANVYIDGGLISTTRANPDSANVIFYAGNTVPEYISGGVLAGLNGQGIEFNLYSLTVFKRAPNTYTVLQANTIYGLGY